MQSKEFSDQGIRIFLYIEVVVLQDSPQKFVLSVMNGL